MNKIYSITGPSGVGKSTISKIIKICLGYDISTIISSDDSHKWERNDENWKFFTHLNPQANNLQQEINQIANIKNNLSIKRKKYDHCLGKFTKPEKIEPTKNIIYEGLHTMHGDLSKLADVSFYIEVEDSIKKEWKILRDSKKRGYSVEQIIEVIDRRKQDEKLYIEPQKQKCDVVIKFSKSLDGDINIQFDYEKRSLANLINDIKKLYNRLQNFIKTSRKISKNIYLTQNKGGNLSFKFKDIIVATESGSSFDKINYFDGFGFYKLNGQSIFSDQKKPSMEIGCHSKLGPCCLHTHPLHLMAIICSTECDEIINQLIDDICIVDYVSPGKETQNLIKYHKNIIIKNHGMFISRQTLSECLDFSLKIDSVCKDYLLKNSVKNKFLFPDAFVLQKENEFYHSYVQNLIQIAGLTQKPLSEKELTKLENMEEEKYRKRMI